MRDISKNPGIYIHIPFCVRKCNYCAFLSAPETELVKEIYVDALIKEIKRRALLCNLKYFDTVYFGGGTPTTLRADQLKRIIQAINESFHILDDAEYTIEANPGTVTAELLTELR
ncbi:MAG: radical SAM protein, partial [Clostridiales bacterium]|nr:radical SAM protein [Candidatus Crickella merdequi]